MGRRGWGEGRRDNTAVFLSLSLSPSLSLSLSLSLYLLLLRGTWCVCGVGVGDESVFFLSRGGRGGCMSEGAVRVWV